MMQKYNDGSVAFEYDDMQFMDVQHGRIKYIGSETDGSRIKVPDGVVDGTDMFRGTRITSGARLPDSMRIMDGIYSGCVDMKDPGIVPDGVINMTGAYAYTGIRETPVLPDSVENADFAFDHCMNLEKCVNFPDKMESAVCMFSGDASLKELPEKLPDSLINMDGFACSCTALEKAPVTGKNVRNMSNAYASCMKLGNMPDIPEGAVAENVIDDCYTLEHQGDKTMTEAFTKADERARNRTMDREAALNEITDSIHMKQDDTYQMGR